ncbi:hypothetical protein NADFUDRAFT_72921 [Nadsonia fulvescens var. elongata DSM 6958]|uniref:25S rRNA adenine-N(1) methyltransferase n=1 Tax=Nadsonia fulvescens var. elongata DSM 6958 TaxID=857566 RepID=A0A1E3PT98_9ASCO|nr:hypothetical protein NADFUDRAFT_72921 [Nadsonia fulvescens var. elongata DSM 6958]
MAKKKGGLLSMPRSIVSKITRPKIDTIGEKSGVKKMTKSASSKHTRTIIRALHTLMKNKALMEAEIQALSNSLATIESNIALNGGLDVYQKASILGQDVRRGGDSSKILVEWLKELNCKSKSLSMLEVGCLSSKNFCSRCNLFNKIERIDLNSQEPLVKQQDFMKRPYPTGKEEEFDIISLSLVVNFVPIPADRGLMLYKTVKFLSKENLSDDTKCTPCLFFVLPLPCVSNSRYCNEERITQIMNSLGYSLLKRKQATKLIYWLWKYDRKPDMTTIKDKTITSTFKKDQLNPGGNRNNFHIILENKLE